jgi:large repetitive protein
LAEEGPAEQIRTLISPYASRLGNNDQFNPAEPNCAVKIQVRSGGFTEGFQSGSEWQSRWTASGTWQTVAGTLTHPSGANATLAPVAEVFNPNFALYVEVTSPAPITDTLGVALSGNNSLAWQPSTQQWVCTIAGQNLTPLAHPTSMAQQWLLIGGDRSLLFYADGQLLFSQVFDKTPVSAVQLFTGANAVGLRNLTWMQDPVVNIAYQDAAGRVRQTHTLLEQDSLVSQTIYNWAGGPVAVTKPAPGSFGVGRTCHSAPIERALSMLPVFSPPSLPPALCKAISLTMSRG